MLSAMKGAGSPGIDEMRGPVLRGLVRSRVMGLAMVAALGRACAGAQEERCGAGKDLVVQALERVTPGSSDDEFEDALQLLKHAVSTCSELGDAWYYRSLVEQRLGHAQPGAVLPVQGEDVLGSDALRDGVNPFVLATPPASPAL